MSDDLSWSKRSLMKIWSWRSMLVLQTGRSTTLKYQSWCLCRNRMWVSLGMRRLRSRWLSGSQSYRRERICWLTCVMWWLSWRVILGRLSMCGEYFWRRLSLIWSLSRILCLKEISLIRTLSFSCERRKCLRKWSWIFMRRVRLRLGRLRFQRFWTRLWMTFSKLGRR